MNAKLIDGRHVADQVRHAVADQVSDFRRQSGRVPGLAVILVGNDPASQVYVRMKEKAVREMGMHWEKYHLPAETEQKALVELVRRLGEEPHIDGILVQLPLPDHLDEQAILSEVNPEKDVDGFHPINSGRLFTGGDGFVPCTPAGILKLIESTGTELAGKEAVVLGRSIIVGRPAAALLLRHDATVTICHSKTRQLEHVCRRADVLVVAIGRPRMISPEYVKPGAVVIDVGVNRLPTGKLVGDVDFDAVREVAGYITPVPGGVGPMTIAMLLNNTMMAAERRFQKENSATTG